MKLQHADVPPDGCSFCCQGFATVAAHHATDPATPLTLAVVAAAVDLSERMTRLHLSHLVLHRRIEPDRRTPVPGAMVGADLPLPDDLTPLAWTAWVRVPCRTCRDLLTALAVRSRGTWRGQVSMADLGSGIGLGEHATRMHVRSGHTARGRLGHSLVAAGLVAFEASAEITGKDRNGRAVYTRHPDRFVLWPTQQRPPSEPLGGTWQEDQAAALLDRIVWFDVSHPQAVWVVRLVGELLGDWPEDELERRLNVTPRTALPLKSPYLFARRRLPERGESFTRPTAEVIGIPAERMTSASLKCPGYRRPTCTGRPIRAGMFCPACEDEARENGDDSTGARMAAVPAWGASGPLLASA